MFQDARVSSESLSHEYWVFSTQIRIWIVRFRWIAHSSSLVRVGKAECFSSRFSRSLREPVYFVFIRGVVSIRAVVVFFRAGGEPPHTLFKVTPNQAFLYTISGVVCIQHQYWCILTPCSQAPDTIRELFSPVVTPILEYVWKVSDGNDRLFVNNFAFPLVAAVTQKRYRRLLVV
ncbi:hypothetical protein AVEN_171319-1 [Araneus ventricosus]|uniref:Uncharacterized protein n=1 Tax=Araneus ventricosus TaxID=182803 RepID=A0A4Y2M3U7_ARAVE|nr:hypothetical protein AVEN_171319-1 [Araneus ventricosus]